ncbi:hypothetical protein BO223_01605 [Faecalibaculum rodentium]|nr:hypothetical protein BO223_01605 [Faecalibaculum rodentium]
MVSASVVFIVEVSSHSGRQHDRFFQPVILLQNPCYDAGEQEDRPMDTETSGIPEPGSRA